jgi:hypothetical protein
MFSFGCKPGNAWVPGYHMIQHFRVWPQYFVDWFDLDPSLLQFFFNPMSVASELWPSSRELAVADLPMGQVHGPLQWRSCRAFLEVYHWHILSSMAGTPVFFFPFFWVWYVLFVDTNYWCGIFGDDDPQFHYPICSDWFKPSAWHTSGNGFRPAFDTAEGRTHI